VKSRNDVPIQVKTTATTARVVRNGSWRATRIPMGTLSAASASVRAAPRLHTSGNPVSRASRAHRNQWMPANPRSRTSRKTAKA
jgi:hypothetical protein